MIRWNLYFSRGTYGLLPRPMLVARGRVRPLTYWQALRWVLGLKISRYVPK
jgi:hypothetical protein